MSFAPPHLLLTAVIALAATTGCDTLYTDLGSHPVDEETIDEDHKLVHIVEALDGDTDVASPGDLLALGSGQLTFARAPDPSALLREEHERHQALPALGGEPVRLRVLVQNVGLLQRDYIQGTVEVPRTVERREVFADVLVDDAWDVMLLSEVWEQEDVDALAAVAEPAGYVVYGGSEPIHAQTGVVVVVREAIVSGEIERSERQFFAQYQLEQYPGPNLRRGFVQLSFDLAGTEQRVHLISTHFTSFIDRWGMRSSQARELGIYLRDEIPDGDIVLLGGDFNAAPYYPRDVWVDGADEEHPEWWANTIMYPALLHYGQLVDAHNAVTLSNEVDLWISDQVPPDGTAALLNEPMGDAAACDRLVPGFFTAIDCNSLHFESYAGTEYPQRLDYLFFRDLDDDLRVIDAGLAYYEPLDIGGEQIELSDHYGVRFTIDVRAQ